jgi:hypothetical protein
MNQHSHLNHGQNPKGLTQESEGTSVSANSP